uniref:Reverse transcriptase domain-containing protein n=1 Tax=Strongyloides venezuelensis TaxID=75913 RepID=A0A0K0FZA5_STRVS
MRESQVHGKVQILAKMPKWRPDTNPALRREFYMNYQMCMPPGYRKEAESFLNTLEDTGVEKNPHRCRTKDNNNNHVKNKTFLNNKTGNFNKNRNVSFNDNKKIYSNVNQGNIRRTVSSNVANNNVKFNIPNKERATKFRQKGPQVNVLDIESLTDKICSKMQDLILTAKVSTLITFCLLMFFIAPAGTQSNILNIYP